MPPLGEVLLREDLVDYRRRPRWEVFPNAPPLDYASTDTRERWCWGPRPGCDSVVGTPRPGAPWDVDAGTGAVDHHDAAEQRHRRPQLEQPTTRSVGTEAGDAATDRTTSTRGRTSGSRRRCNPDATFTSPQRNDIDAARANLFAMHNQMHDWSYHLGFTEATFNMQRTTSGRRASATTPSRATPRPADHGRSAGRSPPATTPTRSRRATASRRSPTCTCGSRSPARSTRLRRRRLRHDRDRPRVHATRSATGWSPAEHRPPRRPGRRDGRELVGPVRDGVAARVRLPGRRARTRSPSARTSTGDQQAGIRNYGMNDSPLNYSDVGYDLAGPQVHADGEIWSATNFAIRRHERRTTAASRRRRRAAASCADGPPPVDACPGNRRWIQLVFDAWLLMPRGAVSMVDARDAMLAADRLRFGGANQDLLWNAFARAASARAPSSTGDDDADRGRASRRRRERGDRHVQPRRRGRQPSPARTVRRPLRGPVDAGGRHRPGDRARRRGARSCPALRVRRRAPGYGTKRLTSTFPAGRCATSPCRCARTWPPAQRRDRHRRRHQPAKLIDDTEATTGPRSARPSRAARSRSASTRADRRRQVHRSRSARCCGRRSADDGDPGAQNRFSALRCSSPRLRRATAGRRLRERRGLPASSTRARPTPSRGRAAAEGAGPDHALVRHPADAGDPPAPRVVDQPVHRRARPSPGDQDDDPWAT